MRFLHVADVHLDTSFCRPLRRASAGGCAKRHRGRHSGNAVDLAAPRGGRTRFLIAGDLFDGDRLSFRTERFLLEQISRLVDHDVAVVYATGNHDPGDRHGGPRRLAWPPAVHVASDATPRRFLIQDRLGEPVGYVTTIGHATDRVTVDLSRTLPRPAGELPEVGLLHTQVRSAPGSDAHGPYAPSELAYLLRAGFDYWALGHVHGCQMLSEDPPIWYSGCPQGRTHADQGERGALLVDLSDRRHPTVSFRSLAPVRWETVTVSGLEAATTLDDVERVVQLAWQQLRSREPAPGDTEWMVRAALHGPSPLWSELRTAEERALLEEELTEILGVLDVTVTTEAVHPVAPIGEYAARTDVLGETLRLIQAVRSGEIVLDVDRSQLVGPGPDGEDTAAYVRSLLAGVDGEIASRLLGETLT